MLKHFLTILLSLGMVGWAAAQSAKSCCGTASAGCKKTDTKAALAFAKMGSGHGFAAAHLEPLPMAKRQEAGKMILFPTDGGTPAGGYLVASGTSSRYLLLFHEWWGLNDYIKQAADKLAKDMPGVNVLALDLYDSKVATTKEEAQAAMQALKPERAMQIVKGAAAFAGEKATYATIGWCMGGGYSLQGTLAMPKATKATVMYYGMPETSQERLKTLNGPVLFVFAAKDQWINTQVKDQFVKDMKAVGKKLEVITYDADHAFANPSNPQYDKAKTDDAYSKTLAFLKKNF